MQNQNKQINELLNRVTKILSEFIDSYTQKHIRSSQYISSEKFRINISDGAILINDVIIVDKKSKGLRELFKTLIEQHIQDVLQEKDYMNYSGLSIKNLVCKMKDPNINIFDAENQIKEMIYRLRKLISSKLCIEPQIIIETVKSKGGGDKSYGYRLNPQNVVFVG